MEHRYTDLWLHIDEPGGPPYIATNGSYDFYESGGTFGPNATILLAVLVYF
jgi:hypothetical protein